MVSRTQVYRRLLKYLRPYWRRFSIAILATIVVGALNAMPALLVRTAVDDVLVARDSDAAFFLSALVMGIFIFKGGAAYLQNYFMYWVGQRVVMDVRNALHRHLLFLPLRFFDEKTTGELMAKVTYDITLMRKAASNAVRDLVRHFFTFLALLAVAVYQSPKMSLFFIVAVPPVVVLIAWLGEKIRRITRRTQERMGDMSSRVLELALRTRSSHGTRPRARPCAARRDDPRVLQRGDGEAVGSARGASAPRRARAEPGLGPPGRSPP